LQEEYGILVTSRSGFIRVSPHIDNDEKQIHFLMDSLEEIFNLK
jgi:selenocysteine lyase/cysteine desulfurase